jgi:hypothetical protein
MSVFKTPAGRLHCTAENRKKKEPVAKVGYCEPSVRCTGLQPLVACSFSPYGLQNCGFQAVAVAKLQAHPVLPGEIATASKLNRKARRVSGELLDLFNNPAGCCGLSVRGL